MMQERSHLYGVMGEFETPRRILSARPKRLAKPDTARWMRTRRFPSKGYRKRWAYAAAGAIADAHWRTGRRSDRLRISILGERDQLSPEYRAGVR